MTAVKVSINHGAAAQALARLEGRALAALKPALQDVGEYLLGEIKANFRKEQSPEGVAWAELSPRTRALKKHKKKLQESGRLFASLVYQVRSNSLEIGSNMEYAAIHQLGGKAGRGRKVNIPARPFLPQNNLPLAWEAELLEIVADHYSGLLNRVLPAGPF